MIIDSRVIDPLQDGISRLSIVDYMGSDKSIVKAARISTGNDIDEPLDSKDRKLISFLLRNHHYSCFEHCFITFEMKIPVFAGRQLMRHRSWNFNEASRRHTSESIEIYIPTQLRYQSKTNRQTSEGELDFPTNNILIRELRREAERDVQLYNRLIQNNVAREQARYVLPQSLYTRLYATASLRSIFHFVALRDHEDAQPEIAAYSKAIKELSSEIFPICWREYDLLQ